MDPYDEIVKIIKNFLESNPDIQGCILLSKEGLPIYSALPREANDTIVSAMSAAILSNSERGVLELARGDLRRIIIDSVGGSIVLSKAGENAILCTLVKSKASLGKDGMGGNLSYPYIFTPPFPPGDLKPSGQGQLKHQVPKESLWEKPYCKNCGSIISKGQSICHVCKKKVI
jgi:predicted regulator of Ras-like GTPase activity (Roadblock/LC7/MglB family)